MAATSAGLQTQPPQHQQQQQQQQSATNVVQQKLNGSNTNLLLNGGLGGGIMRNTQIPQQQPPQIHNLQQQQQLMQQYAMKQQQHANFLQHQQQQPQQQLHHQQQSNQTFLMQQTPSQQHQQQQIYQISQQTQQQQQMFHSQNNQFASNMMPCQNFMTPPPQLHSQPNRFTMTNSSNNSTANNTISVSSNTITWSQQYQNLQNSRKQPTIVATNHHKQPPSPAAQIRPSKQPPYQQQQQQQLATSNNHSTNPTNNDSGKQLQMVQQQQQVVPPVNMQQQQQQQPQQQLRQEALQNIVAAVAPKPVLPTQTLTPKSEPNEVQINIVASDNTRQIQVTSGPIVANKINNNNNNSSCDLSKNQPKETTLTNGLTATAPNESSQLDAKPNIAPGWQRQSNNNNEIVYISPTGVTLRSPFQIKDYLLTSGTCKCGLPCPLRPEYFFNFNVQVPNTPLMAATTTVYQNNNGFNNSSSLSSSSHTATVTTITSNSFSLSSASSSSSSSATTATASSPSLPASNTSSSSSSPSSVPNALASSTALAATTVPSGAAPTTTLDTVTATIPSATPSSSLTCLHQRRFLDCQQLHAQPTELFNKDVKRRRLAANSDSASMSDSNSCFDDMPPATIDSDSMFASTSSAAATRHHCTSQNYKMMPPSCTMEHHHHHPHNHHQHHQCGGGHQQQVQSQQHLHHRHHHHHHTPPQQQQQHPHHQHQQRPQPVITNCYNNNNNMMTMENSSRPWCKDNGIMSAGAHHQHETDNGTVPWSQQNNKTMSEGNICPHRQHHHHPQQDQRHHHHQQPQHHHCSEFNNNEEQKPCHFKDDLNGYLQQQTEMVHNSLVDVQQQRHHHHHHGHGYDHSDDDDGEEDEDEEDDDLASGINEEDIDYEENDENDETEDNPMDNMEDHDDNDEEDRDVDDDDDDPETEDMLHLKTTQHCLDFLQGDLGMDLGVGEDHHSNANDDGRQIKSETCTEAEEANIEDVNMEPTKHEEDHNNDDEEEEEDDEVGDEEGEEEDDDEEEGENSEDLGDAMASHTQPMEQTVIEPIPHPVETRLLNNQSINTGFYQITAARQEDNKQNENPLSNLPRLSAISLSYDIKTNQNQTLATVNIPQPQESPLMPCPTSKASIKFVPTAQESPVSSSTLGGPRSTPDLQRATKETSKKPEQVGAISTSNESPRSCTPSPASNMEVGNNGSKPTILSGRTSASPMPSPRPQSAGRPSQQQTKNQFQQVKVQTCQKSPVRIVRQVKNVNQIQTSQQQRIFNNNNNNNNNRATLTTIAGNRGMATTTTTTSAAAGQRNVATNPTVTPMAQKLHTTMQKFVSSNNNTNTTAATTTTIPISQLQLQPLLRAANDTGGNSQIIMTSTGQIIVMPSSNNKTHLQAVPQQQAPQPTQQHQQQLIIASGNATATSQTPTNLIIQQSGGDVLNNAGQLTATLQQQPNGSYIVSQPAAATAAATNNTTQLQPTTVILNPGQNILTGNTAKVLTATNNPGANIIHATGTQSILTAGNQLLTAQTAGNATNVLGQQTVVLNPLPNGGYVIQPQQTAQPAATQPTQQFATLDSQVVSQIVQQADGTQRIIISSPADLKRRTKKRKTSPTPNTQITNQTATILQPHTLNIQTAAAAAPAPHTTAQPQVVQLTATTPTAAAAATASNAFPQQFQLGSAGIQGIVVSKPATATTNTQPQQIILQNGQIIQPMNLLGQQLILPTTGLVMGPDSTLLQIQNVNGCAPTANILTAPQATTTMMLRATSPQTSKSFISSTATGQQFIVGSNGQLSPIGQIYSTPMGLMMPATTQHHTTTPTATFVQHNGTTIQLHHHHHQHQQQHQHPVTATAHQLNATTTTTHHQHQVTLQALQTHQQNLNQVINNPVGIVLETAASSTSATASPNLQTSTAGSSRSSSSAASPPDTTTHSPRSPERPPSHRSGGSDMVQCVSSSEPDGGNVSPMSSDSRQSPSTTVCDKGIVMSTAYQQNANIFKPSEAKIRRVQTPPQYHVIAGGGVSGATTTVTASTTNIAGLTNLTLHHHHQHTLASNNSQTLQQKHMDIKPDTHDSPQNSPTTTVMLTPPPPRTPTPLQQQQQHQQLQQYHPQQQNFLQNSSTISVSENRLQHQSQQQLQHNHKTPTKQTQRNRNRSLKPLSPLTTHTKVTGADAEEAVTAGGSGCGGGATAGGVPISPSASSTPPLAMSLMRTFAVGELIWGPARGFPAWPGKVVKIPDNQQESVWVQWFGGGGRSNTEIMPTNILQSLSEGLEAHHKAQKDTRKSRKLNSQLEKAIQEAMTELDRISATSSTNTNSNNNNSRQQPTSSTQHQNSPNRANKRPIPRTGGYDLIAGLVNNNNYNNNSNNNNNHNYTSSNTISTTTGSTNRTKPIRIAPAPPPPSASASSPMKTNAIGGGGLAATSVATTSSSVTASNK